MTDPRDEAHVFLGNTLTPGDLAQIRDIIDVSVTHGINERLLVLGIDLASPRNVQADMIWVRSSRERCERIGWQIIVIGVGLLLTGAFAAFWIGFKVSIR